MKEQMVTAGKLREAGLTLPYAIPDHAEVPKDSIVVRNTKDYDISISGIMTINVDIVFTTRFSWK